MKGGRLWCNVPVVLLHEPWYTPAMHFLSPSRLRRFAIAEPRRLRRFAIDVSRTAPVLNRSLALGGLLGLLCFPAASCSGTVAPDDYLGTVDGSGFDPLFGTNTTNLGPACIGPRAGYAANGTDTVSWYYLGTLSQTQLDISNSTDPTRTPVTGAYAISGCAPGSASFDPRTDNYVLTQQYPIIGGTITLPTKITTYKPWQVVFPAKVVAGRALGCNDIKSEKSLQARGGYDLDSHLWNQSDRDVDVNPPTLDQIRAGMVTFKDWPIFNVAAPLMKTQDPAKSCPLVSCAQPGMCPKYPKSPGDPAADFQFPTQNWVRGLLGGYLDGGDLPISTNPMVCKDVLPAGNTCMTTGCVCPQVNTVYMSSEILTAGKIDTKILAAGTVTIAGRKSPANLLATFAATPGQPGYSPICQVKVYDPTKVVCTRKEDDVAPRPLCTVDELKMSPAAAFPKVPTTYVHCLFLSQSK